ncbi:hypothetical protein E2C01_092797 [Portunus trituberculatus]|uniref:Uncharacterized protein n=1 Tax=Portunus trituberculatus TaxID=210409 RepID=A0A5B7JRK7_PORTR|nr:hypothetical protein [Portunus trituberculatus]
MVPLAMMGCMEAASEAAARGGGGKAAVRGTVRTTVIRAKLNAMMN